MTQQEINNSSMLKVGTILHGTYRIDSYLSSGGFGNTYVATNIEFEEKVAIKEFFMKGVNQRDDNQTTVSVSNTENHNSFLEQKEKFKKEARRIRQLRNSHIVNVHDLFDENGTAYYVMDYVDGENLAQRMKRTGKPMSEKKVREILPQVLDALKDVHDAGIWHLDLKPANIMVDKAGNVKLIDFGASKQMDAQKGGATTSTAISYTNGYAPREQMEQNYDKFGPWTDIYALGATLYNLLTNKRPPLPTDIDDDITADKHEVLPFPNGVSKSMKNIVLWMMKTNRVQRPQDVNAIVDNISKNSAQEIVSKNRQNPKIKTIAHSDEDTIIVPSQPKDKKKNGGSKKNIDDKGSFDEETIVLSAKEESGGKKEEMPQEESTDNPIYDEDITFFQKWKYWLIAAIGVVILVFFFYNKEQSGVNENDQLTLTNDTIDKELYTSNDTSSDEENEGTDFVGVDLGLPSGIKWANMNLGASKESDFGDYYAWGGIKPFESFDEDCTQYNKSGNYNICGTSRDAAHVILGDKWRIPKYEEFEELMSNCKWLWTSIDGQLGFKITGQNGNSIFLPAGGTKRPGGNDWGIGEEGFYWTGELYRREEGFAKSFQFNEGLQGRYNTERCDYLLIRPVFK